LGIKNFLELLVQVICFELLNSPEDCIISKHPLFDLVLENKEKFITKVVKTLGWLYKTANKKS
jgi:hypothetical protein